MQPFEKLKEKVRGFELKFKNDARCMEALQLKAPEGLAVHVQQPSGASSGCLKNWIHISCFGAETSVSKEQPYASLLHASVLLHAFTR